MGMVAVMA